VLGILGAVALTVVLFLPNGNDDGWGAPRFPDSYLMA
jgi:hypothetical protein